ncbi:MAG: DUF3791 domain-containing protein [Planctomycetia bacterium]|nr:DUF3791 domain-containing protein [Planctomycetia bacterium]
MAAELKSAPIQNKQELEFAVFCIENVALKLGVSADKVYLALTEQSTILNDYIIPCFEVFHSLGKEYIVEDILSVMKSRGVSL